MSRKHYIQFAAMMAACNPTNDGSDFADGAIYTWVEIRRYLADILAADNPAFDRARFIGACNRGAA